MNSTHRYEQLIEIFNGCFADDFNTRLIKGDDEPIYLPADTEIPYHRIVLRMAFTPAHCMNFALVHCRKSAPRAGGFRLLVLSGRSRCGDTGAV